MGEGGTRHNGRKFFKKLFNLKRIRKDFSEIAFLILREEGNRAVQAEGTRETGVWRWTT